MGCFSIMGVGRLVEVAGKIRGRKIVLWIRLGKKYFHFTRPEDRNGFGKSLKGLEESYPESGPDPIIAGEVQQCNSFAKKKLDKCTRKVCQDCGVQEDEVSLLTDGLQ